MFVGQLRVLLLAADLQMNSIAINNNAIIFAWLKFPFNHLHHHRTESEHGQDGNLGKL